MTSADALLQAAGAALVSARELGPNAFQVYLSGETNDPVRLASLEQSVRAAARDRLLDIEYQPQVSVAENRIVGVEALLRFEHPVYGRLTADTLLSTAERGEFSLEFGRSILRQAFGEASTWSGALADLRLSVNVTAADMHDPEFVTHLIEALGDTGFPPERLTLEITEGSLVENLEATAAMLNALKRRRISVAIDDFGTGYSSLAYLKSLPLDYLKIDKRIAADITGETRDKVIVRGVIDMARSLDMTVIAEGVETEDQLDLLIRAGCNWYQGFLCSGAMRGSELEGFIANWAGPQLAKETA
jgi:EAL domain-containing protein (putative c-di-GMP-specific phosphodiesterase class I)